MGAVRISRLASNVSPAEAYTYKHKIAGAKLTNHAWYTVLPIHSTQHHNIQVCIQRIQSSHSSHKMTVQQRDKQTWSIHAKTYCTNTQAINLTAGGTAGGTPVDAQCPKLDCDHADVIFADRSNKQLLRALFALQCCSSTLLVKNSMKVQ